MKFLQKILFVMMVGLVANTYVIATPWTNNTREHLFGTPTQCATEDCAVDGHHHVNINHSRHNLNAYIRDEGFRWRNTFNFRIKPTQANPARDVVWHFCRVKDFNTSDEMVASPAYVVIDSVDTIQAHLSKIADKVKEINSAVSASACAISIVIEDSNTYHAFPKVVNFEELPIVASSKGNVKEDLLNYATGNAINIIDNLNDRLGSNIPPNAANTRYECTEEKILSQLFNNFENADNLFKKNIYFLLQKARTGLTNAINYGSIKLIVLHVGTTMDPCAVCTRNFVGLSKYFNSGNNIQTLKGIPEEQDEIDGVINARFLIEVSSNGHYQVKRNYTDHFSHYSNCLCSHTECAGHDNHENDTINIILEQDNITGTYNMAGTVENPTLPGDIGNYHALALPLGWRNDVENWKFKPLFSPYVIFGRMRSSFSVSNAPRAREITCPAGELANHYHLQTILTEVQ